MELALRRAYYGLGQSGEVDTEGGGLPTGSIDVSSGEGTFITPWEQDVLTGDWSTIIPATDAAGQMTGPVPPLSSSQLIAALKAGTVVLSKVAAGSSTKPCLSGYSTPQGQCVPLAPGASASTATSGQILSGVSNQTLLIGAAVFFLLIAMGGKRR